MAAALHQHSWGTLWAKAWALAMGKTKNGLGLSLRLAMVPAIAIGTHSLFCAEFMVCLCNWQQHGRHLQLGPPFPWLCPFQRGGQWLKESEK